MGTRCINAFPEVASDFDSATNNSSTEVNNDTGLHLHSETHFHSCLKQTNKQTNVDSFNEFFLPF